MALIITFIKVLFFNTRFYENCLTDLVDDCRYTDFQIAGVQSTLGRCGSDPQNLFFGPFGQGTTVLKTFNNIPLNSKMELSVGIWKFDTWDGEGVQVWANDVLLRNVIIGHDDGVRICRVAPDPDKLEHMTEQFIVDKSTLTIKMVDKLDESVDNESWGFRDLYLRFVTPCVIFYSECNYQGNSYKICQGENLLSTRSIPFEINSVQLPAKAIVKMKSPNYKGGNLIEITTSQVCFDSFKFPKYIKSE